MAEIAGATVDFTDYSAPGTPRILNIPDGAGDVTVQDLWDTLSAKAALLDNLVYKKLIDRPRSGGKIELTTTKQVGISMTMNNVQVKFPDQPGPGIVRKRIQDGNLTAIDHLAALALATAVSANTYVELEADTSAAIVGGDIYTAKVLLFQDSDADTDVYVVSWFKNGRVVTSGISSPTIRVVRVSDGSDLIPKVALVEIGSLGRYRYLSSGLSTVTPGKGYLIVVEAVIDGQLRTWDQPIGIHKL